MLSYICSTGKLYYHSPQILDNYHRSSMQENRPLLSVRCGTIGNLQALILCQCCLYSFVFQQQIGQMEIAIVKWQLFFLDFAVYLCTRTLRYPIVKLCLYYQILPVGCRFIRGILDNLHILANCRLRLTLFYFLKLFFYFNFCSYCFVEVS